MKPKQSSFKWGQQWFNGLLLKRLILLSLLYQQISVEYVLGKHLQQKLKSCNSLSTDFELELEQRFPTFLCSRIPKQKKENSHFMTFLL